MFSPRVPRQLEANRFSRALGAARAAGRELIDLTISNPTRAGIVYREGLFASLGSTDVAHYAPEPFGLLTARQAVVGDYTRRGVRTTADRIVLTASTSEAYSLLFKLLCAPAGDAVLVPVPQLSALRASDPARRRRCRGLRAALRRTLVGRFRERRSHVEHQDARGARGQPEQSHRLAAERRRDQCARGSLRRPRRSADPRRSLC